MKSKHTTTTVTEKKTVTTRPTSIFERENLLWMLGGAVLMILGYLMMSGGRSEDPNVFDPKEVYSTTRITIAPIMILAGLVLEIIALFRNNSKKINNP